MKELIFVLAFIGSFLICSWLLLNSHKFLRKTYLCSNCWKGTMVKVHNRVLLTDPVKYEYVCDRCGHREYRLK